MSTLFLLSRIINLSVGSGFFDPVLIIAYQNLWNTHPFNFLFIFEVEVLIVHNYPALFLILRIWGVLMFSAAITASFSFTLFAPISVGV